MKNFTRIKLVLLIIIFLLTGSYLVKHITISNFQTRLVNNVFAEDDEDDDEDKEDEKEEDDDEDEDDDDFEESLQDQVTVKAIAVPKITYVWVVDPGYDVDTDKDGLVDAIDPDPNISQKLYFTDSDDDSVPDAFDLYTNYDDLKVLGDTDSNSNGILDSFE